MTTIAQNKKAFHDYEIVSKLDVGLVLTGGEIKSIRAGFVNLKGAYVRVIKGELWLLGCHIRPYEQGGQFEEVNPTRDRKLLAKRREIGRLMAKTDEQGMTIVPLRIYLTRHLAKLEIALAKSKKQHDKRETIKQKDIKRQLDRAIRQHVR